MLLNAINPSNYYQHISTPLNKQRFFSITPKNIINPKFMQPSNDVGIKYQSSKSIQNVIGDKLKCFFCGGFKCKYEDYTLNENQPNAIKGLHSNYIIEDSIITSQRLSSVLITNFNLISEFKSINIGLIVNLQNPFEHAFCGPNANNMHKSGYAYDPNIFINEGITCISYGWTNDYDFKFILNIVKEIAKYINHLHKKVLIHCHAGYNRTGIIIGAYMMYMKSIYNEEEDNKGYIEIVNEIKMKRRKCLTRKEDVEYLKKIELNIKVIKELFGKHKQKIQIEKYLINQINLYYVLCFQQFNYQNIPLLIFLCVNK